MTDTRSPWKKLTNIAAAAVAVAELLAVIWPEHGAAFHAAAKVALALLGVGVVRRVARYGEDPS